MAENRPGCTNLGTTRNRSNRHNRCRYTGLQRAYTRVARYLLKSRDCQTSKKQQHGVEKCSRPHNIYNKEATLENLK